MQSNRSQDPLILAFIILSLLLHLLLLYLLPHRNLFPEAPPEPPVVVEMRPPQNKPFKDRELDVPVPPQEQKRETPAKRLGPADQQVQKETAPKGDFLEDRAPRVPQAPSQPQQSAKPPAQEAKPAAEKSSPKAGIEARPGESGPKAGEKPAKDLPDKDTLMAALNQAAANVAEQHLQEWRRKYREDVEEGNAVWLDMENDLLNSFFKRFRDNIYGVWSYPARSAERGEQGKCLLKVTVNKDGTLKDVQLKESTGYPLLDQEAVDAVRKGAPYGKLSRYYDKDTLTIFVVFQYNLSLTTFRPGDLM